MPTNEVKGAWLVTARRYILQEHDAATFDRYVLAAPEPSRDAMRDPSVSRWYPESVMHDALESFFREVSQRDAEEFTRGMERCTVLGTHWFVQMLVSVSSPPYLVRLLPAALRQLRRGPVRLHVELGDREATLRFTNHPYSDHPCYRLATPAILRALLRLSAGQSARATMAHSDATSQVVILHW
jgi:hypothetical protein